MQWIWNAPIDYALGVAIAGMVGGLISLFRAP